MATDDVNKPPSVELNIAEISHPMAARLTSTLLGHMLYMKGQVPFPVNSLERMSTQRYSGDLPPPDTKLTKKRKEFLDAYDDLLSHLRTTFVALSTAFANNPKFSSSRKYSATALSSSEEIQSTVQQPNYRPTKVYLFLAMGSSLTLPKARVLLELDNFCVEKFGEREFINRQVAQTSLRSGEDVEEADSDIEDTTDPETASDTEEELDSREFFSVPSTPCRTASFYTASPGSEPPDSPSSGTSEFSEESEHSSPETSLSEDEIRDNGCHHQVSSSIEDPSLYNSERVLSKALVQFGEELGFEQELAPTHTHILLLAPRRFSHPTWIPRQNLTPLLNKTMHSIIKGETINKNNQSKKTSGTFGSSVPAVGLRILCQSASSASDQDEGDSVDNNVQELDELIWWSWDGKLVGFSDS